MPPENASFWEFFDYFWDNGVGNVLTVDGDPMSWTSSALADVLDHKPNQTSILNWRKRKHLPKQEQLQRLCRILFVDEPSLRKAWSSVLIKARREEELLRQSQKKQAETEETSAPLYENTDDRELRAPEQVIETTTEVSSTNKRGVFSLGALCLAALLLVWNFLLRDNDQSQTTVELSVHNIRFCLEQDFFSTTTVLQREPITFRSRYSKGECQL